MAVAANDVAAATLSTQRVITILRSLIGLCPKVISHTDAATTLDREQRLDRIGRIARIFSEELPALTLFYRSVVFAHTTSLTGLMNVPAESTVPWNMYEWELR